MSVPGLKRERPNSDYMWRLSLLGLTALRLLIAWRTPLSADEAYYWVWSKAPAWGYLDHPPMVAAWIRVGCAVAGDTGLGVRLLAPVAALFGTLLLAGAARDLTPDTEKSALRPGLMAALLFNATLACNAGAVVMTPDTPLLFFWTAGIAALARLVRSANPYWWLAFGLASGLALDSKYTAVLLGGGVAAWLVFVPQARRWWSAWQLWAGAGVALLLFSPVLEWNAAHDFASFAKQGGRAGDWRPAKAVAFLGELLGGQIGLATPVLAVIFAGALSRAARALWRGQAAAGLLACITLLPSAVFVQHAFGGRVQANWPAVIYPGAVLACVVLGSPAMRFWRVGVVAGLAISACVMVQAAWSPWLLPRRMDFTLIRLGGWQDLAGEVFARATAQGAHFVAADEYGLASELAFRLRTPTVGVERRWRMFELPAYELAGQTGLLVRSARQAGLPAASSWAGMVPLGTLVRGRHGVVAETYFLYRVTGRADDAPAVALPANAKGAVLARP